jgi:coatomer protein complex subunit gamma
MAATAQDSQAPLRTEGKKDEDFEEETEYSPFYGIEKGAVLQEARVFHEQQLDPRRCQQVITKLLYLICQGENFTSKEATEVFFAVTKLFQNKDANLRRMVYLIIREMSPGSDEVIIVTSSLMKDMTSNNPLFQANAIRVLSSIIDSSLLQQIERFFKSSVVSKDENVASAALVAGLRLAPYNIDIIKRWASEVQEAVQSRHPMVQAHAVALLHKLRQSDRLAVSKLVTTLTRGNVRSSVAQCLLVRYVSQVIRETQGQMGEARPFYDYLEQCMRHKSDMVIFEAARAVTQLNGVTAAELHPAVSVLQLFLTSSKPILRFAAIRTLNRVAMTHPGAVADCAPDMEGLLQDKNRSISTLAITALLKVGNEGNVDRLMGQISSFMADIADDFKIVVVDAVQKLCLKYPNKYRSMMGFLSGVLREEGGFEYKRRVVESILNIIKAIPGAKESGLLTLCEFIEDCEFTYLSTQILHLLGQEGPQSAEPARYIRYIFNRLILENATVRASAVSALARFGAECDDLRPRVAVLLKRALHDNDDEVRDRATMYLRTLGENPDLVLAKKVSFGLKSAEGLLRDYLDGGDTSKPFDLSLVPEDEPEVATHRTSSMSDLVGTDEPAGAAPAVSTAAFAKELNTIPELAELGDLFKSSKVVQLVESEAEYSVTCVKHTFPNHIVFQFDCGNTIPEQVVEGVSVSMDLAEAQGFSEAFILPLDVMPLNAPGKLYVCLEREGGGLLSGLLMNSLQFAVKEVDPSTGEAEEEGFQDEYQLEDLEVGIQDYLKPTAVPNFRKRWEDVELADEYGLGQRPKGIQEAVTVIVDALGLQACEGTDAVPPNARSHMCLLSGVAIGGFTALARVRLGIDAGMNVAIKLEVRSDDESVSEALHAVIGG